jgi:hypothetical protein
MSTAVIKREDDTHSASHFNQWPGFVRTKKNKTKKFTGSITNSFRNMSFRKATIKETDPSKETDIILPKYTLTGFEITLTLGTGSFGRVHLVKLSTTNNYYAKNSAVMSVGYNDYTTFTFRTLVRSNALNASISSGTHQSR